MSTDMKALTILALLLLATEVLANRAHTYHVIPTCANSPGRFGANFKTRVVIHNPLPIPDPVERKRSDTASHLRSFQKENGHGQRD